MPNIGTNIGSVSLLPEAHSVKGRPSKIAKQISLGHASVSAAAENLRNGEPPHPTPTDRKILPRLEFTVSAPDSAPWHTDIFDYAGEKVNPNKYSTHEIVQYLREVDALFVFAPCPTNQNATLPKDMQDLAQVLTTIQEENKKRYLHRVDIPIILLVNKWDQAMNLDQYTFTQFEQHRNALEKFIVGRPEYLNICTMIKAVVGEDNFYLAPTSALGMCQAAKSDPTGGNVVPKHVDPLRSLGLIEPLIWACKRCDQLVIERALRLANEVRQQHFALRWLRVFSPKKAHKKLKLARAYAQKGNPNYKYLGSEARKMLGLAFLRSLQTLAFLSVVTLLTESALDQKAARANLQVLNQDTATVEQQARSVKWLRDYAKSPSYKHFVYKQFGLSLAEANTILDRHDKEIDDLTWGKCGSYVELDKQIQCIDFYSKTFSQGQHIQEALNRRVTLLKQADEEAWQILVKLSNETEQHSETEKYVRNFPNGAHIQEARELRSRLGAKLEWQEVLKAYQGMIEQQDLTSALSHLIEYSRPTSEFKQLKSRFERDVLQVSEQKAKQKIAQNLWEPALKEVEFYNSLPLDYQSDQGRKEWNTLRRKVHLSFDRVLYEAVRNNDQDKASYERYINQAGSSNIPGVMSPLVQKNYQSLQDQLSPQEMSLSAYMLKDDCELKDVKYSVNGSNSYRLNHTSYITVKPTDYITIGISGHLHRYWPLDDQYPSEVVTVQAKILATQGKYISFICKDDTNKTYQASFRGTFTKNISKEPWREWEGE